MALSRHGFAKLVVISEHIANVRDSYAPETEAYKLLNEAYDNIVRTIEQDPIMKQEITHD